MVESLHIPVPQLSLPALGAAPVDLEAVGSDLEVYVSQETRVDRAFLELGDAAAGLTDQVVVMVFGQLVARAVPEIQPPHHPDAREKVEGPVDRHQPHLGTAGPDLLQTLVLLRRKRPEYRDPLRRRLVSRTT